VLGVLESEGGALDSELEGLEEDEGLEEEELEGISLEGLDEPDSEGGSTALAEVEIDLEGAEVSELLGVEDATSSEGEGASPGVEVDGEGEGASPGLEDEGEGASAEGEATSSEGDGSVAPEDAGGATPVAVLLFIC